MADNIFKTLKDKFQSTDLYKSGYFDLPEDLGGKGESFDQITKQRVPDDEIKKCRKVYYRNA